MKVKKWLKDQFEEKVIGNYLQKYHYDIKSNFREEDVFIVGYPKSGNTWMQNLIAGLIFGIDTRYLPDRLTQELVPPVKNRRVFKRFIDFNCFKSHELPQKEYRKVILLIRDGRDVMESYKSMNDKMGKQFSLEQMIKEGKGLYPCRWHEFYDQWEENKYGSEILLVKYEDLLNNCEAELKKIANFLNLDRDEETISKVVSGNAFQEMRSKRAKFGYDGKSLSKQQEFFRKGEKGSFKKNVDAGLIEYFNQEAGTTLKRYNYL